MRILRAAITAAVAASLAVLGPAPSPGVSSTPAAPGDTTVFTEDFESGNLGNWTVVTRVEGTARVVSATGPAGTTTKLARVTVPNYDTESMAYIRRTLADPAYALSATGWFQVRSGGCDDSGGYSAGNVPFFRFFDASNRRIVGLYRINGSCSRTAKLYVQHSGSFFRTGKNISFGDWVRLELRATINAGESTVSVHMDDQLVYQADANNGIAPIASVNIHNEHPNQVGDLLADDIRFATFPSPVPTNPCNPATPQPSNPLPGTTLLADNFESYTLNKWSSTGMSGDGFASVDITAARTGNCGAMIHVSGNASSRAYLSKSLGGATELWADGWFNVKVQGASGNNVPFWRVFDAAGRRVVDVYRTNGAGALYLRTPNGSGGYTYTSLGRTVPLNTWHRIRVHVVAATGVVQVWYDGVQVANLADRPVGSGFRNIQIHAEHFAQQGDLAVDDVVLKRVP